MCIKDTQRTSEQEQDIQRWRSRKIFISQSAKNYAQLLVHYTFSICMNLCFGVFPNANYFVFFLLIFSSLPRSLSVWCFFSVHFYLGCCFFLFFLIIRIGLVWTDINNNRLALEHKLRVRMRKTNSYILIFSTENHKKFVHKVSSVWFIHEFYGADHLQVYVFTIVITCCSWTIKLQMLLHYICWWSSFSKLINISKIHIN